MGLKPPGKIASIMSCMMDYNNCLVGADLDSREPEVSNALALFQANLEEGDKVMVIGKERPDYDSFDVRFHPYLISNDPVEIRWLEKGGGYGRVSDPLLVRMGRQFKGVWVTKGLEGYSFDQIAAATKNLRSNMKYNGMLFIGVRVLTDPETAKEALKSIGYTLFRIYNRPKDNGEADLCLFAILYNLGL